MIEEIVLCLYFSLFIDLNTLFVMLIGYIVITELVNKSQLIPKKKSETKKAKKNRKRKLARLYKFKLNEKKNQYENVHFTKK